jgi:acetyl esterase/lipase
MRRILLSLLLGWAVVLVGAGPAGAWDEEVPPFTRTRDVIYGRKFGLALTLDVFVPKKGANGIAVVSVVSGGWFSRPEMIAPPFYHELLRRGYTVFAVVHGSQPRFTIDSAAEDISRAVRFIRYHAKTYRIDPERIGIIGASAGGHLALLQGTAGDKGNPKARDPIDRVSSRVQAVGCFFPPTDFLNYGEKGREMIDRAFAPPFTAAVDYHEFDAKKARYFPVTDKKKLREIARRLSPITHVNAESAPALLIHGDKDRLVPIQQSEGMVARLREAKVPARLVVRKGADHGWLSILEDMALIADWFDKHLRKAKGPKEG